MGQEQLESSDVTKVSHYQHCTITAHLHGSVLQENTTSWHVQYHPSPLQKLTSGLLAQINGRDVQQF